ncbi:AAA family ATPase [Vibrio diabolicus]|uniref:AAA family ATPase n=1 Tax=Vibrio diabolicus TaxID=50719 RepID=UPI002940E375|nr:AAA family ATPase [Vibrio diabolicus]MDV5083152.1 AAA family ATPase [Vibrio diabolicus]
MDKIRARNLRSFSHSSEQPYIDLKPITVFVGKNSCGKSSLLRTLPLLRQSIESRTSGPILWYGQYVDYGAFSEAKNNNSECDEIFLDYKFELQYKSYNKQGVVRPLFRKSSDIELELGVKEKGKRTVASSLNIIFEENEIYISLGNGCTTYLNNKKVDTTESINHYPSSNGFLPSILSDDHGIPESDSDDGEIEEQLQFLNDAYEMSDVIFRDYILDILKLIKPYSNHNSFEEGPFESEIHLISNLNFTNKFDTLNQLFRLFSIEEKPSSKICEEIYSKLLACFMPKLIENINEQLEKYSSSITYIAPLRASAERFYRFQDLRVEQLDHTGSNLAMLLQSFSKAQMNKFQHWSQENFGFKILLPETNSLHYEIKINIDNEVHNISDMGFGFSQILPIITSLWFENNGLPIRRRLLQRSPIFVIEQPELHLHPELQALLAKVFISVVHKAASAPKSRRPKIIFETHSKTMIDALGDYIEEHQCPDLVNIVIFNKQDGITNIETASFDEEGDLSNWPIGFFSGR